MKRLKSEKGVITIVTLITVLFMVSFLISSYIITANKVKTQKEMLEQTREIYKPKTTMEEVYNSYFNSDNIIPIYTVEQLLAIGSGEQFNIDGKIYTFSNNEDTAYFLKNNLEFSAIDLEFENEWMRIDYDTGFLGNFDWNGHTIEVTTLDGESVLYNEKLPSTFKESIEELETVMAYENLRGEGLEKIRIAVDTGKISAVLKETINGTETIAVVPTGYEISTIDGEDSISGGLVIADKSGNEFVWIPVGTKFAQTYSDNTLKEPLYLVDYDTQAIIDNYYGTKEDGSSYYTIDSSSSDSNGMATNTTSNGTTFDYGYHYNEMVTSVNKYKGFYIGRYETTMDGSNIGSKAGATVVSANLSLPHTNNKSCRWWGLYYVQRNSNVTGNGNNVQTNMIWGQQWNAMITFFGNRDYSATTVSTLSTDESKQPAGQSKYKYNLEDGTETIISDEICNIYDLRGNVYDRTGFGNGSARVGKGGYFKTRNSITAVTNSLVTYNTNVSGSRMTLYIK